MYSVQGYTGTGAEQNYYKYYVCLTITLFSNVLIRSLICSDTILIQFTIEAKRQVFYQSFPLHLSDMDDLKALLLLSSAARFHTTGFYFYFYPCGDFETVELYAKKSFKSRLCLMLPLIHARDFRSSLQLFIGLKSQFAFSSSITWHSVQDSGTIKGYPKQSITTETF